MKRLALLCLLALACGPVLAGTTRKVPAEHATIQDAVDNSVSGDIIALSKNATTDGVYYENVTVPNTITGLTFTGKVIWDGTPPNVVPVTGRCLTINGSASTIGPYLISGIIFRNATDAVFADSGAGNEVDNLTVTGCQGLFLEGDLVDVRGDNFVATKNVLLGCDSGFAVDGDNATVSGNKFTQCSGDGVSITFAGATQSALVDKNVFFLHDGGDLIDVDSDNAQILSNQAKSSVGFIVFEGDNAVVSGNGFSVVDGGITTNGPSNDGDVIKNKLASTAGNGIEVEGNNSLISGNSITNCSDEAIRTDGLSPDVLGNKIKIADRGITCSNADGALLDKNSVSTILGNDGINVSGDALIVTNNSVTDAINGDGIQLSNNVNGGATVDKNKVKNASENGFTISSDGTSAAVTISNCSASFAGSGNNHGFNVTGDNSDVIKCKASNIDGDGFRINADNCNVTDCSATKCGYDGFDSDGSSAGNTFTNCKASACGAEGFDNSTSTGTLVEGGSFTKNRIDIAGNTTNGATITLNPLPKFVTGGTAQVPQID